MSLIIFGGCQAFLSGRSYIGEVSQTTPNLNAGPSDGEHSLASWIEQYQPSLQQMVQLRMDRRLRSRVDPSDILQEAFIEAARRYETYSQQSDMPPHLWLRFLVHQQLLIAHRKHVAAQARDVTREQSIDQLVSVSGETLLDLLVQSGSTPSQHLSRAENIARLYECLEELEEIDREILVMRHFEQFSINDTALSLDISVAAASQRYYRALKRITAAMKLPADEDQPRREY